MARNESQKRDRVVPGIAVASLIVFAAMAFYAYETRTIPESEHKQPVATKLKGSQSVDVARPVYTKGNITLPTETKVVPEGEDKYVYAVNEFLRGMKAVPAGAKANTITVEDGVATIDFNPAIKAGYGTDDESQIVEGLLKTMGSFTDVKTVRFLINGQVLDTLGDKDLSTPQPVIH